jgi:hypothetical protein
MYKYEIMEIYGNVCDYSTSGNNRSATMDPGMTRLHNPAALRVC